MFQWKGLWNIYTFKHNYWKIKIKCPNLCCPILLSSEISSELPRVSWRIQIGNARKYQNKHSKMSTRKRRSRGLDDAVSYIAKGIKSLTALFSDFNIDMCLPFTIKIFIKCYVSRRENMLHVLTDVLNYYCKITFVRV